MSLATKSGFANLCGISASNVTYNIKTGKIKLIGGDGPYRNRIDTEDPINVSYRELVLSASKTVGHGGRPAYGARKQEEENMQVVSDADRARIDTRKEIDEHRASKLLDAKLKSVKIKRAELEYEERKKNLIPIAWIARAWSEMSAVLEAQFREFDARVGDELCDIVGQEDPAIRISLRKKIRNEIDISLQIWKSDVDSRLDRLLSQ